MTSDYYNMKKMILLWYSCDMENLQHWRVTFSSESQWFPSPFILGIMLSTSMNHVIHVYIKLSFDFQTYTRKLRGFSFFTHYVNFGRKNKNTCHLINKANLSTVPISSRIISPVNSQIKCLISVYDNDTACRIMPSMLKLTLNFMFGKHQTLYQ